MTFDIFKKVLAIHKGKHICIGGGEPTIHPLFWQFITEAINNSLYVWLATNGKEEGTTILLAEMAKKGILGCCLSLDKWHEKPSKKVIKAFEGAPSYCPDTDSTDRREMRAVETPARMGRAKNLPLEDTIEEDYYCICSDLVVHPNGKITQCGCNDSPVIGNVWEGYRERELCFREINNLNTNKHNSKHKIEITEKE